LLTVNTKALLADSINGRAIGTVLRPLVASIIPSRPMNWIYYDFCLHFQKVARI